MKKILIFALALLTALSFTACKEEKKKNNNTQTNINTQDEFLSHIDIQDYDGYNFRILTRKNQLKGQYVEEETGDIINDAVYRRNETVKMRVKISELENKNKREYEWH